jgi:hypothetical protein
VKRFTRSTHYRAPCADCATAAAGHRSGVNAQLEALRTSLDNIAGATDAIFAHHEKRIDGLEMTIAALSSADPSANAASMALSAVLFGTAAARARLLR